MKLSQVLAAQPASLKFETTLTNDSPLLYSQGPLTVNTGDEEDSITVHNTGEDVQLNINSGGSNDNITIKALRGDGTVLGGDGNDYLEVDARDSNDESVNTMDGTTLIWNGGNGNDELQMYFVSAGTTNLNVFGDGLGTNKANIDCSDVACTVLSRRTFLANIHDPDDNNTTIERLNIDNASIASLRIYLHDGNNSVHFDDTIATMEVFGGRDDDSFYIGQVRIIKLVLLDPLWAVF